VTPHTPRPTRIAMSAALACALVPMTAPAQTATDLAARQPLPAQFVWTTVANSADAIPGGDGRKFNSFNQPSVNAAGRVVLRARSRGGQGAGEPLRGIYARPMAGTPGPLVSVFDTLTEVPAPNNTLYQDKLGTFTEFPAFPRVGLDNDTVTTRAQSRPVWTYTATDGTETRVGTSGIYAQRGGERVSAMTQLGAVPGFEVYSVPGAAPGTRFDQFPGAPAVANANTVVFKGNYTEGTGKTGIFFRSFGGSGVPAQTQVIASSDTTIPGQPADGVRFASTSPPSASARDAVFLGLDNEEAPTLGGIYLAPLATRPALQTLASIGGQAPGESAGTSFNRLGEALSYDGRFVAYWGAWGTQTRSIMLTCPTDGQAAVIAFCLSKYPNGLTVQVPANQGFFVHDVLTRKALPVAKTGGDYVDFLYWVFSGRPPGVGDGESEDFEEPRWRASSFVAAYSQGSNVQVAFKARRPTTPVTDGIYLALPSASPSPPPPRTVVETMSPATLLDPMAPAGATVVSVGLERDGLRNRWLAITASMLDAVTSDSWAGVYVTRTGK